MEPLFFKAENVVWRRCPVNIINRASMEPLFFKAENELMQDDAYDFTYCFNGAAFFQSGKCVSSSKRYPSQEASMEPLFFKAENLTPSVSVSTPDSLQWSRFFSKRKIFQRGHDAAAKFGLQWSRFFSKRKMPPAPADHPYLVRASMEPLFFKAENVGR